MKSRQNDAVLGHVQQLFGAGTLVGMAEVQLLERFLSGRDEVAFEALVARHGPMVLGVCRRLLSDTHDVEDAFQATFLVLVRRAHSLRRRDLLGNWLYGVAHRVAVRARAKAARRRSHEQAGGEAAVETSPGGDWSDLRPVLDEELERLPEKYRAPVVLCFLEGRTHEEAAQQLRWPLGTVKSRLARARARLQGRLARRGLAPSAGLLGALFSSESSAAVGTALVGSTVKAAMRSAAGRSMAGVVPASVASLTEGVLRSMVMTKLKTTAVALLGAGVVTAGATGLAFQVSGGRDEVVQAAEGPQSKSGELFTDTQPVTRSKIDPTAGPRHIQSPARDDEVELLELQLEAKQAELRAAEALIEQAMAGLARIKHLHAEGRGSVSNEEVRKASGEVDFQAAQRDVKRAEVREAEVRLRQAKRLGARPDGLTERSGQVGTPGSPSALEHKLREMDRKLDRLIEAVEGLARERGRPALDGR